MIDWLVEFQELIFLKSTSMYVCIFVLAWVTRAQLVLSLLNSSLESMWCRSLTSLRWPHSILILREAHIGIVVFLLTVKAYRALKVFVHVYSCSFIHIPIQKRLKWIASCGKVAVWFKSSISSWSTVPGAPAASLALLIPVLLMHARHLPGALFVPALCCWFPELMCVLVPCFSGYFPQKRI